MPAVTLGGGVTGKALTYSFPDLTQLLKPTDGPPVSLSSPVPWGISFSAENPVEFGLLPSLVLQETVRCSFWPWEVPATASPLPSRGLTACQPFHIPVLKSPVDIHRSPHWSGARPWVPVPCEVGPFGEGGGAVSLLPAPPSLSQGSRAGMGTVAGPSEWHPCSGSRALGAGPPPRRAGRERSGP